MVQVQSRASLSFQNMSQRMNSSASPSTYHRHVDVLRAEAEDLPAPRRVPIRLANDIFAPHSNIVPVNAIGAVRNEIWPAEPLTFVEQPHTAAYLISVCDRNEADATSDLLASQRLFGPAS